MSKKNPTQTTRRRIFTKKRVAILTGATLGVLGLAAVATKADEPGVEELEETHQDKKSA